MTVYCSRCGQANRDLAPTCSACGTKLVSMGVVQEGVQKIDRAARRPVGSVLLLIVCVLYLLNPGSGIIDIIPDNLPIVGNLDEAGVAYLLVVAIRGLGWSIFPRSKR
jgi:hypothetical protein